MKLLRVGAPGEERPAVRTDDGTLLDLSSLASDIDGTQRGQRHQNDAGGPQTAEKGGVGALPRTFTTAVSGHAGQESTSPRVCSKLRPSTMLDCHPSQRRHNPDESTHCFVVAAFLRRGRGASARFAAPDLRGGGSVRCYGRSLTGM